MMRQKIEQIAKFWYIIIPILCVFLWAMISVVKDNFYITDGYDFG